MAKRKYVSKINFKNKSDYSKWLKYNWIHNKKVMGKKPDKTVYIGGKLHKVSHNK